MICEATTRGGTRCRAYAKGGERFCTIHLGTARNPTKLDETTEAKILAAVRAGCYPTPAVEMAGVHKTTFYSWRERGEAGEEPFASFLDRLKKARAEGHVALVARIRQAADAGTWQAAAWLLERQYPDLWARRERHELSGPQGEALTLADLTARTHAENGAGPED